MERTCGTILPQAASPSWTRRRVNSASQSALAAVMVMSASSSTRGSFRLDEVLHGVMRRGLVTIQRGPAGDHFAVVAQADPSPPGVGAVRVEGEVEGAFGADR